MSKTQEFKVVLKFSDNISKKEEIEEISNNIMNGLIMQYGGVGLSPEDSNAFTLEITVQHSKFKTEVNKKL